MVVSIGSAVEESAFAAVRVRRYGNLCVTFTPELKILAYEFHMVAIDHSYPAGHVHAELRLLRDALLQQQRGAAAAAAGRGDAGTAGAAAAALQAGADAVQALGWGLDAQLAARTEDGYARRFMRGLKVADLVASMGDLLDAAASAPAASPLAALQAYAVAAAAAPQPDPSQARAPPRRRARPACQMHRGRALSALGMRAACWRRSCCSAGRMPSPSAACARPVCAWCMGAPPQVLWRREWYAHWRPAALAGRNACTRRRAGLVLARGGSAACLRAGACAEGHRHDSAAAPDHIRSSHADRRRAAQARCDAWPGLRGLP